MDKEKKERLLSQDIQKLTGCVEHWLTTFHQGYWGFRPDQESSWNSIEKGDVFVFHASGPRKLNATPSQLPDNYSGIIGMGVVGDLSTKENDVWLEELRTDASYPYLVHFSEIYWFGDTEEIEDKPVSEKSREQLIEEVKALTENIITFTEMEQRTGYRIPAQGSPANIAQQEKLRPLLSERLDGLSGEEVQEAEQEIEVENQSLEDDPEVTEEAEYSTSKRRARNAAFKRKVRQAYGYECAICGRGRESPKGNPEVEAAHIYPKSQGGRDVVQNGIALCKLHHWAFDTGWIRITEDYQIEVAQYPEKSGFEDFSKFDGEKINMPETDNLKPHPKFIRKERKIKQ